MNAGHQIAFFLRELSAPDPFRRAAAAKGLGRIGQAEHAEALARAAGDPEPVVRAAAALGLGRLGVPGTGDVLIGLLEDADSQVRRRATVAADRLALTGSAVTEVFGRLLRDEDWHVRLNALVRLTRLRTPADPEALVRLLGDPEPAVCGHAWGLVVTLKEDDDAVLAEMLRTAREGPGAARARTLQLLPARYTAQLRDSLLTGLRDEAPEVRQAVVGRLAGDPDAETPGVLLAALVEERDPDVARKLLDALAWLGERRTLTAAVRWLDHPGVGPSAVRALVAAGTPTAIRQITSVLVRSPGHPYVRAAAASGLQAALGLDGYVQDYGALPPGSDGTIDLLTSLTADDSHRVRRTAAEALEALGR